MTLRQVAAAAQALLLVWFAGTAPLSGAALAEVVPSPPVITPKCPVGTGDDEAVVCGRLERSPYRLPPPREGFDPRGSVDSVSRERNRLLDVGAAGIHSCSTVGPGGSTGCDLIRWKEAHEQWDGHRRGEPRLSLKVGPLKKTVFE